MKISWNVARFIKSAVWPEQYPPFCNKTGMLVPQIALSGRSNVGKSSLINTLLATKQLAKVSNTPGKTQLINFFCVSEALFVVDLPGYGFAKCPQPVKNEWGVMINRYFESIKDLSLLLFLLDIRRTPNEDDLQLFKWAAWHKIPTHIILTKADKLNREEKKAQVKKNMDFFPNTPYILYSSHSGEGVLELRKKIISTVFEGQPLCQT